MLHCVREKRDEQQISFKLISKQVVVVQYYPLSIVLDTQWNWIMVIPSVFHRVAKY